MPVYNKNRKAVAITYSNGEIAPKIVAKGQGYIAQKIIDSANESNVAVYTDDKLVEQLVNMDLGSYIPPELYEVVAQILVFIGDLDKFMLQEKSEQENRKAERFNI